MLINDSLVTISSPGRSPSSPSWMMSLCKPSTEERMKLHRTAALPQPCKFQRKSHVQYWKRSPQK